MIDGPKFLWVEVDGKRLLCKIIRLGSPEKENGEIVAKMVVVIDKDANAYYISTKNRSLVYCTSNLVNEDNWKGCATEYIPYDNA